MVEGCWISLIILCRWNEWDLRREALSALKMSQKSSHANQVGSSFSSRNSGVQVAGGVKETVSCQTAPQQEEPLLVREGSTKFSMPSRVKGRPLAQ